MVAVITMLLLILGALFIAGACWHDAARIHDHEQEQDAEQFAADMDRWRRLDLIASGLPEAVAWNMPASVVKRLHQVRAREAARRARAERATAVCPVCQRRGRVS